MTDPYDGIIYGLFVMERLDISALAAEKVHGCMFVLTHYQARNSTVARISPNVVI